MNHIFHLLILTALCNVAVAQTREREVISSGGGVSINGLITYTIGETVIDLGTNTTAGILLTQGFQQPTTDELIRSNAFDFTVNTYPTSCVGLDDGRAMIKVVNSYSSYTVLWNKGTTKDTLNNLAPGNYTVEVTTPETKVTKSFTITQGTGECNLEVKNGMLINGDGINEIFYIKGIEQYLDNTVTIYNRWGGLEWSGTNYDNVTVVFKGINAQGAELPSGTYFYNFKFKTLTGETKYKRDWLELTR